MRLQGLECHWFAKEAIRVVAKFMNKKESGESPCEALDGREILEELASASGAKLFSQGADQR